VLRVDPAGGTPGYVLRVEKDELDVQRFEHLAKEGRSDEALALWRGPPLLEPSPAASPNGTSIIKRIRIGGKPWGMAFGADRLWVTVD
jgi:hypothetical protein